MPSVSYSFTFDGLQLTVPGTTDFDPLPEASEPFGAFVDLGSLVLMSLLTDARAPAGDAVPDPTGDPVDRGGWWGDVFAADFGPAGDRWGSLFWLLRRTRATRETINRARRYAEQALSWLVEDGVAERVDVEAERVEARAGRPYVAVHVTLTRGAAQRYRDLWEAAA